MEVSVVSLVEPMVGSTVVEDVVPASSQSSGQLWTFSYCSQRPSGQKHSPLEPGPFAGTVQEPSSFRIVPYCSGILQSSGQVHASSLCWSSYSHCPLPQSAGTLQLAASASHPRLLASKSCMHQVSSPFVSTPSPQVCSQSLRNLMPSCNSHTPLPARRRSVPSTRHRPCQAFHLAPSRNTWGGTPASCAVGVAKQSLGCAT